MSFMQKQDTNTLINWAELSRKLSGSDNSIRPNKVPKKYKKKVDRLIQLLEAWERWSYWL